MSIDTNGPPWHDWTIRVGYGHYGFGGSADVTTFHYGTDFTSFGLPFFATIACTSLLAVVIAALLWRVTHRHENAV